MQFYYILANWEPITYLGHKLYHCTHSRVFSSFGIVFVQSANTHAL